MIIEGSPGPVRRIYFKAYSIGNWLGREYKFFQKVIFGIFVAGGIGQLLLDLAAKIPIEQAVPKAFGAFIWWFWILIASTVLWIILREVTGFDLYFYYFIWLKRIAPILYGDRLDQSIADINASYDPQTHKPTLIRREHLTRRRFWPLWVFHIILLLGAGKISEEIVIDPERKKRWNLNVDLRGESFGIYSNGGKRFMRERYEISATSHTVLRESQRFFEFTLPATQPGTKVVWGEFGEKTPFRWASGGFLPIVSFRDRYWAALFFRDISPVGLNVANGGSETKEEAKDLHRLIGREFSEEVIIVNTRPTPGSELYQNTLVAFSPDPSAQSPIAKYISPEFAKKHVELRYKHDHISIEMSDFHRREISPLRTPFQVNVTYHYPDLRTATTTEIRNVVYSVNAIDFAIEVIWLCTFKLHDGEYIIDGEYHLGREILIRRPAVLLDMDYLRQVYKQQHSLGETNTILNSHECKLLPPVPAESCIVFDADIELRHKRLEKLMSQLRTPHISEAVRTNVEWEKNLIASWLSKYEAPFAEAKDAGLHHESLRSLCPVTWKTLELIFAHRIKYEL